MATVSSETLHASCVAIGGRAVLIEGPSGSGKSDLALRLIDRGARLVSDDYTILVREDGALKACAPANIAGQIEVRAIGIVEMEHLDAARVALLVRLVDHPDRLPLDPGERRVAGVIVPEIALNGHEVSAPIKVELALKRIDAGA
jgi:serine kinase of HPr protein (carbohydrate metabolism regulator)